MIRDRDRVRRVSKAAKEYAVADQTMTSDEWCSPPEIARGLYNLFGGPVGVDPCSNDRSIIQSILRHSSGGLVLPWCRPLLIGKAADTAYSNWPYSKNEPWSAKAVHELHVGNLAELVILCMTAASTVWWKNLMHKPKRNPRVICTKRLKFIGPTGKPVDSSRFEPALIYYGRRTKAFDREFKSIAMWNTWGRS